MWFWMCNTWSSKLAKGWKVRGSNPGGGEIFRTRSDRLRGPPSLLHNGCQVFFPGLKRPGIGVDHPPPPSAEVKERVELYLSSPFGPSRPVLGWTFTFKSAENISGSMCTPGLVRAVEVSMYIPTSTFQDRWSVYRFQNSWFWSHTAAYAVCRRFPNANLEFRPKSFQKGDSWRTKWHSDRLLFTYFCFPLSVPPHQYTISHSFIHTKNAGE
jgi:hypothetical protein